MFINGTRQIGLHNKVSAGTSHEIFELNGDTNNQLIIEFKVEHDVSLIISEIEVFGIQKVTQNNNNSFEFNGQNIQLFISSIYFTITLALIIPLLISVVVICIRIKRQTRYLPSHQNPNNYSHLFNSKEILRYNDQSNNSNSRTTSFDPSQEIVPLGTETNLKRLDTNALNNMYERIPTLPTGQEPSLRKSKKFKNSQIKDEHSQTETGTNFPSYSLPTKKNRPASHDGYLEIRNLSVDERIPTLATPQDDDPYYDYVRPRSAGLQVQECPTEPNDPIHQYLNTKQIPNYVNTNTNTAL